MGHNYLMYVQYDNPVPVQVTVRNIVLSGRGPECPIYVHGSSTLVTDHNLFCLPQNETVLTHGETAYTCANIASLGTGNLCSDPRFVRPAWGEPGDYHLQAGSPAIDAGTADGTPTVDLENRPRDAQPDIGAYEYRPDARARGRAEGHLLPAQCAGAGHRNPGHTGHSGYGDIQAGVSPPIAPAAITDYTGNHKLWAFTN